jgi:hypothetical protein
LKEFDAEKFQEVKIEVEVFDDPQEKSNEYFPNMASLRAQAEVSIKITDLNDNKPIIEYNGSPTNKITDTISELAAGGTQVFELGYSDRDVDETNSKVAFRVDDPNAPFYFTPDGKMFVKNDDAEIVAEKLDYETRQSKKWVFTVTAENPGSNPLSAKAQQSHTVTVELDILDEDEPPIWDGRTIVLREGDQPGTKPNVQPHATDPDFGSRDTDSIVYSITADGDPDGYFDLDSKRGHITLMKELDRESPGANWRTGTYDLTMRACDPQNNCAEYVHSISIIDVNDNGPVFYPDDVGPQICNRLKKVPKTGNTYNVIPSLTAVDKDDCKSSGHCGPFNIQLEDDKVFKLIKLNADTYKLNHEGPGPLEVKTYSLPVTGTDGSGFTQQSFLEFTVCRCDGTRDEQATCDSKGAIIATGNTLASVMAIVAAVIIVFSE